MEFQNSKKNGVFASLTDYVQKRFATRDDALAMLPTLGEKAFAQKARVSESSGLMRSRRMLHDDYFMIAVALMPDANADQFDSLDKTTFKRLIG